MYSRAVQDHGNDAQAAILGVVVSWLNSVLACKSVFDVEVHVKDVVTIRLLNDGGQLLVLLTNLADVLSINSLLGKVDQDAPSPVLRFLVSRR